MKRATLHIIVNSVCCAKIKGVDKDVLESDRAGGKAEWDDTTTDTTEST